MAKVKIIPAIRVTGCRAKDESRQAHCPNTRHYDPNEDGETLGCTYKYGTLPEKGFPEWCPLDDEKPNTCED